MEDLNIALCTVPFYERNCIEETLFSESDILTMKNRSMRFKQKYFNDKSYATADSIVLDKTLNILRDSIKNSEDTSDKDLAEVEIKREKANDDLPSLEEKPTLATEFNLNLQNDTISSADSNQIIDQNVLNIQNVRYDAKPCKETKENRTTEDIVAHDDFIFRNTEKTSKPFVENFEPNIKISDKLVFKTEVKEISDFEYLKRDIGETNTKETTKVKVPAAVDSKVVEVPPGKHNSKDFI